MRYRARVLGFAPCPWPRVPTLLGAVLAVGTASAQDGRVAGAAASAQPVMVSPSVSINQTITDNVNLRDADKRSDAVTVLTVGVRLTGKSARVQGALDYQLSGSVHVRESAANGTANALRATLRSELIDDVLFVDAGANISQTLVSAFGSQPVDRTSDSANVAEVRGFYVTPTIRGTIGGLVRVDARLHHVRQSNAVGSVGDQSSNTGSISFGQAQAGRLGWTAVASRQLSDFSNGRSTKVDSYTGGLNYRVDSDLRVSGRVGREQSDVVTRASTNTTTWGLGLDWTPTDRTRLAAQRDQRYFGSAHSVTLSHRMARSLWRFSSSRDVSSSPVAIGDTGSVALADLLFANLAAVQPDPDLRRLLVEQQLARMGYAPDTRVSNGFLAAAATLVNRQELSVALQGIRSSASLSFHRSKSRRVDRSLFVDDDLSQTNYVTLQGVALTVGHRLTPESGLTLTHTINRNRGTGVALSTEQQSTFLNWTTRLGQRGNFSLGVRHVEFDSPTTPYTENALIAILGLHF